MKNRKKALERLFAIQYESADIETPWYECRICSKTFIIPSDKVDLENQSWDVAAHNRVRDECLDHIRTEHKVTEWLEYEDLAEFDF